MTDYENEFTLVWPTLGQHDQTITIPIRFSVSDFWMTVGNTNFKAKLSDQA